MQFCRLQNMRHSRRHFLRTSIGLSAAALQAAADGPTAPELSAMDAVVNDFMQTHEVPGISVAVAREGVLVHQNAYGMADRDGGEAVTPAHLFRIASVSKPIT